MKKKYLYKIKNKNKKFLYNYFKLIYPKSYAKLLVSSDNTVYKFSSNSNKEEVILTSRIKKSKDGFIYVSIPDEIINSLMELIPDRDISRPPYFTKKFNNVGAHITVIKRSEYKENNIDFKDIGKEVDFRLGKFYKLKPDGLPDVSYVYILEVFSEDLENIRKKYNLSSKIKDHNFHITIAWKYKK